MDTKLLILTTSWEAEYGVGEKIIKGDSTILYQEEQEHFLVSFPQNAEGYSGYSYSNIATDNK